MRSSTVAASLALASALSCGDGAEAGIHPSAQYSIVPAPVLACPAGDMVFAVTVHGIMDNPLAMIDLVVSFEACPTVRFPPGLGDEGYQFYPDALSPVFLMTTLDGLGRAMLRIRAGGACPTGTVGLFVAGRLLATRALASPDQDGNFAVGADDVALAQSKLGSADPTADFDGDGTVTPADLDILSGHLGHHAPGMATPVASRTWGTLKLLYR